MNMPELFCGLGEYLAGLNPGTEIVRRACAENPWFEPAEVCRAAGALAREMLTRERLVSWMARYPALPVRHPRRVLIVMAGNIPLVGFFDLLCVLMAGHRAEVKFSGKDGAMMRDVVKWLRDAAPQLSVGEYAGGPVDAVIATGGESANRYFRTQFAGIPALLRGSRQSVAVLSGTETEEELRGLSDDMFSYSGLGCRNVSMLFVPRGYELRLAVPPMSLPYRNNCRQQRALLKLTGKPFVDLKDALLLEQRVFPSSLSTVSIAPYDDLAEVESWLAEHDAEIQCVVSRCVAHGRRVGFGRAQSPTLTDYPDAVDVMEFLTKI